MEEEKQAVIAAINAKKPEMEKWLNRDCWEVWEKKNDCTVYYCDEKDTGFRSIKSEIVIEKPMKEVYDYIADISTKTKYDPSFECGEDVEVFDEHYLLQYYKYKGKLLFSPRDFYVANYRNYGEEASEFFCTNFKSDKYPPIPKIERAELFYAGFKLTKVENGNTKVIYYTLGDMHINQTLINLTLKEVALQIKYMKDILMKK
jgi:hypothetical protein